MLSCPVTFLDREMRYRSAWSSDWLSDLAELTSKGKSRDDSASGYGWDDKHVMSHARRTPMNSCNKHDSASWRFSSASHHFLTLDPCLFVIGGFPPHLLALRCASALPGLCDSQPFQSRGLLQPIPGYPVQDCHPLGGPYLCHLQPVSLHLQAGGSPPPALRPLSLCAQAGWRFSVRSLARWVAPTACDCCKSV